MFSGCPAAPKGCAHRSHLTRRLGKSLSSFPHRNIKTFVTAHPIPSEPLSARLHRIDLPVAQIYTSQAYTHKRALGPVKLDIIQGKGFGWRARRDIATGELLLVSLPLIVLYGPPAEAPENDELAAALRSSWPRLTPLERHWLQLLADCATATAPPPPGPATARPINTSGVPVPAVVAPPPLPLDTLLARARGLVAEGTVATATVAVEEVVGLNCPVNGDTTTPGTTPGIAPMSSSSSSTGTNSSGLNLPEPTQPASPTSPNLEMPPLPPSIFGAHTITPNGTVGAVGVADNGSGNNGSALLADLVARYCYSEPHQDPAVGELLDLDDVSAAGLWPEVALMNHSCAPNVVPLLVGGAMYLRAGRPVMTGEELCMSYMAKGLFRHVADRRAALRSSHGFLCCCPRCIAEQEHFPTRRYKDLEKQQQQQQQHRRQQQQQEEAEVEDGEEVLDDAVLAASLLGSRGRDGPLQAVLNAVFGAGRFRTTAAAQPALLAAANAALDTEWTAAVHAALTAASRPRQQQLELLDRLEAVLRQIEASCADLELPPRAQLLTMASVYGVVRLTCELAELSGGAVDPQRRLQLLSRAADVLEAAVPGSDLHTAAALMVAGVARRVYGSDAPEPRRAELAAASAHVARYGRELLQPAAMSARAGGEAAGLLRRIMDTRRRLAMGSGLAAAMSVMAWADEVNGAGDL